MATPRPNGGARYQVSPPAYKQMQKVQLRPKKMKNFSIRTGNAALPKDIKSQPITTRCFRYIVGGVTSGETIDLEFAVLRLFLLQVCGEGAGGIPTTASACPYEGIRLKEVRVYGAAAEAAQVDNPIYFRWGDTLHAEPGACTAVATRAFASCIVARPPPGTDASFWWTPASIVAPLEVDRLFQIDGLANGDIIDLDVDIVYGLPVTANVTNTVAQFGSSVGYTWTNAHASGMCHGRLHANIIPFGLVSTVDADPATFFFFP